MADMELANSCQLNFNCAITKIAKYVKGQAKTPTSFLQTFQSALKAFWTENVDQIGACLVSLTGSGAAAAQLMTCMECMTCLYDCGCEGQRTCIDAQLLSLGDDMATSQGPSSAKKHHGGYLIGHRVCNDRCESNLAQKIEPACNQTKLLAFHAAASLLISLGAEICGFRRICRRGQLCHQTSTW